MCFMKAMASPVVEKMVNRPRRNRKTGEKAIPILGVPCDAVSVFVRFLYSYRLDSSSNIIQARILLWIQISCDTSTNTRF